MTTLSTDFLGMELPNPFILASGPPTSDSTKIMSAFKSGWGGAVLKTISLHPAQHTASKFHTIRSGRVKWGSVGVESVSEKSVDQWGEEIARIRDSFPERPLIASIIGDSDPSSWVELVGQLEQYPINAFEINGGSPILDDGQARVSELGKDARAVASAVRWVKDATRLPVIVKLSPNVTDIIPIALAALNAGGDGFTATSGLSGVAGVDMASLKPLNWGEGIGLAGEYTGPGLRPVGLRWTAYIAKSVSAPIMGCGGVSTWGDAAEYFTVGASAVQLRNAVIWQGIAIIDDLKTGFEKYLERMKLNEPMDLVGRALPKIVGFDELDIDFKMVATLVESECIGCDLCARVCYDAGFQAITMEGDIAKIGYSKCDGCGLCIYVCPPDIMEMVPRDQ
jgi:dihydropyrimidine dehydrogenase (NAD+) subunit PreA